MSPPVTTGSAVVDLTPPTQNTDGSALTDLAGMRVYYGTSASSLTQVLDLPGDHRDHLHAQQSHLRHLVFRGHRLYHRRPGEQPLGDREQEHPLKRAPAPRAAPRGPGGTHEGARSAVDACEESA